ncbi:MAG: autotransporter domain-containing protein [Akkermansia sp.]|nr:autotransporter domain-containing protein [Akkermansia sp.]
MKLHLPKGLRAALLAVISLASVSYAASAPAAYDYFVKTAKETINQPDLPYGADFVYGNSVNMSHNWHMTLDARKMWGEPCWEATSYTGGYSIFTNCIGLPEYDDADLSHGGWSDDISRFLYGDDFTIYMTPNGSIYYVNAATSLLIGQDPKGFANQAEGITPFTMSFSWEVDEDGLTGTLWYNGGKFEGGEGYLLDSKFALMTTTVAEAGMWYLGTSSPSTETRKIDVDVTTTRKGSGSDPKGWQVSGVTDLQKLVDGEYMDVTSGSPVGKALGSDEVRFIGDSGVIYTYEDAEFSNDVTAECDVLHGGKTMSVGFGAAADKTLTVKSGVLSGTVFKSEVMNGSEECGLRITGPGTVKLEMLANDRINQLSVGEGTLELNSNGDVSVILSRGEMNSAAKIKHTGSGNLDVVIDADKSVSLGSLSTGTGTAALVIGSTVGQGSLNAGTIDNQGTGETKVNAAVKAATVSSKKYLNISGSLVAASVNVSDGGLTVNEGASLSAGATTVKGTASISGSASMGGETLTADAVTVNANGSLTAGKVVVTSTSSPTVEAVGAGVTITAPTAAGVALLSTGSTVPMLSGNVVINDNGIKADSIVAGANIDFDSTGNGTVTAGSMEDVSITVGSAADPDALVTGASSTSSVGMSAAGMSTAGTMTADEVKLKAGSSYAIQAGKLEAAELTAGDTTIEAAAGDTITITNLNKLSATEIDAGHIEAESIEIADNFTVKNATIEAETKLGSNVQLQNVAFAGSLKTSGDFALDEIKFAGSGGYKSDAGTYEYTVGAEMDSVVLSGNQGGPNLQLSGLVVNAEGVDFSGATVDAPRTEAVLTANTGTITKAAAYTEQLNISPYVRAEVAYNSTSTTATITGYNDEENIKAALANSPNRAAAMGGISDAYEEVGAAEAKGTPLGMLHDNLGHIYRASQQEREQLLSAISGASTTVLADSQRRGLRDVQHNLRNRIIQMGGGTNAGVLTDWEYAGIQAWAQADAGFSSTDSNKDECGYDFNTTGATVGANMDLTGNLVVGMSFSASYGELDVAGADHATGNNDAYYLSFFARHQAGRWVQMLILTAGQNQMDLTRNVGGFRAEGETEGSTLSAYYEVGYTCALDYDYNHIIQPLVNISITSAKVDGYNETGSIGNAGLVYDGDSYFYGQVGIGARYQGVLYESVHERSAVIEARAMLTQDFGDATNETTVGLIAGGADYKVKGMDSTGTGFEVGVGLSIPVEQHTTLFADADVTYAPDYIGLRANVGLRYDF